MDADLLSWYANYFTRFGGETEMWNVARGRRDGERLPQRRRGRRERPRQTGSEVDIVASWGAALRTDAVGSQDESRCGAIHKQRPYRQQDQ
jgi:hypothetical protein